MIRLTPRRSCRVAVLLIPAAMFLTACPASFPLTITHVSATPDPVVGAVVTLEVEFQSTEDEDNVTLQIKPPDGVRLIDGDLAWHGSLRAGKALTHKVSLCVLYEGDWRIYVGAYSLLPGGETKYADSETIHFISTGQSGQAVLGPQYTFIQGSPIPVLTPSPVPAPATCS